MLGSILQMKVLRSICWAITVLSFLLNLYIYTYPSLDSGKCNWKYQYKDVKSLHPLEQSILLIPYLGDLYSQYFVAEKKELEPSPKDIRLLAIGDPQINGNWPSTPYIKRLDNYGNDYYLGHIYNMMKPRLNPSHVALMGDIVSSQWIGDTEFYNRTKRILTRSFPRPYEQCSAELEFIDEQKSIEWQKDYDVFQKWVQSGIFDDPTFYHFEDVYDWNNSGLEGVEPLFLNVTGNHDIGYGDTTYQHMSRWRKLYGKDNYWIEYDNDTDHPWRIVMLNSLALDGPLLQPEFKDYLWKFVDVLNKREYNGSTILLTHIPMYKRVGLCIDGPNVEYYAASNCHGCDPSREGLLKSENHLQFETSQKVLNAVFKNSTSGIILTGHDHYGCENYYNFERESGLWVADKNIKSKKWIKEVTVRSIMGDFDGVTGLMTGHFDKKDKTWEFSYTTCYFVVQHVWWAAKVSLVLALLLHSICLFY